MKVANKSKFRDKLAVSERIIFDLIGEFVFDAVKELDAFIFSGGTVGGYLRQHDRNEASFRSSLQSLEKSGYIERVNRDQFLITPKSLRKVRLLKICEENWRTEKWDGFWKIISFDIPEKKRSERAIFRSLIKRKDFIGLQASVFISPWADFKKLAVIRSDLDIEKYVSFFEARSSSVDDDSALRKKFNL